MNHSFACRLAVAGAVIGTVAGLAPPASAVLIRGNGNVLGHPKVLSVTLVRGKTAASLPSSALVKPKAAAPSTLVSGNMDYNGGGVFHSQAPYLIFWDPGATISPTTESLIERYFTDVAHDSGLATNVYGVLRQYYDSHGFASAAQAFSASTQAFVDTHPYPAKAILSCPNTHVPNSDPCLTDAQVTSELASFVAAHGLPTDGPDPTALPANAPEYYVVLPANVNECAGSAGCADTTFCAYHSAFQDGANGLVYAMIPLVGSVLGSGKGCQFDGNSNVQEPNGNQQADVSLKYISHEQAESITDPLPPEGWIDNEAPGSGGEVGDQCNATGFFDPLVMGTNPAAFLPILGGSAVSGNLFDQVDNGDQYYVQSEWSNGDVNCEMTPPAAAISATFAAAASGGSTISLNPAGTLSVAGFSSATWDFGDGTTNFQPSAPAAVSHTYAAAGTYRVALTVVDIHGNAAISTQQMTVGLPPTGSFKSSPAKPGQGAAVSFRGTASDADTGVTTTVTWRFGDGSTGSGLTTSHVYKKRGKHKVTMTITDSAGHTTSISRTVTVATSTITKVKVMHRTNSGATLVITVNAPGKVLAGGKTKRASRPGTVKLQLSLSGSQPTIELKFIPKIGRTVTRKVTV